MVSSPPATAHAADPSPSAALAPLLVVVGPTGSGKSALAMFLAQRFQGEIIACDAVTVYRGLDLGSAKPSPADRQHIPHHGLDLLAPDQPSTAGDYARAARQALADIHSRNRLPILAGGAGLYLRATLDGLSPAPPRDEALRERLRQRARRRGPGALHRLLRRLDPPAALAIHPNDEPKLIRSLETTLGSRQTQSQQWQGGRDALRGYRTLQLALNPPRAALYDRLNARAAAMFHGGLLDEAQSLEAQYGPEAPALRSMGYVQALAALGGRLTLPQAIAEAQQGHRNYAKRQLTWFRRDPRLHWLAGFGDEPALQRQAEALVTSHLMERELMQNSEHP